MAVDRAKPASWLNGTDDAREYYMSVEDYEPLISLGRSFRNSIDPGTVYLQYGLIYRETKEWQFRERFPDISLNQTEVKFASYELFVKMLADEDEFLHAVAILVVPVAAQAGLLLHQFGKFFLRHCGIPLSGISQTDLTTSLFEHRTDVRLVLEPADALGADDACGPLASHELVEES